MRWRIWGSDVSDGNSVLLDVEAENAVDAVSQAHDKKIVVGRVARGKRFLRVLPYLLLVATIGLSISTGILQTKLSRAQQGVAESGQDARRVLHELETARDEAKTLRDRIAFLEGSLTEREKQRESAMRELGSKLASTEETMRNAQAQAAKLSKSEKDAGAKAGQLAKQIETLKQDLAAGNARYAELEKGAGADKAERAKLVKDLERAISRATEAEARAVAFDARMTSLSSAHEAAVNDLKQQLEKAKGEVEAPVRRAGLSASYDAVLDFASLAVGKPAFEAVRGSGGLEVKVTAVSPTYANRFVMRTDKERVFDVTLTVCLADDAPREVLEENRQTLEKYVALVAPKWKQPQAWLAEALKNVGTKGENERMVLLAEYYRISVWGEKGGLFTVRVEPITAADR
jgi:hypothetical protein